MLRPLLAFLALGLLPSGVLAKPAHKQALMGYLGEFLPEKLHRCQLCHIGDPSKEGAEPTRNPFGERLEAIKVTLKDAKKPFLREAYEYSISSRTA